MSANNPRILSFPAPLRRCALALKLACALAMLCLGQTDGAEAGETATVNANSVIVNNFSGWGVSLCWWASVCGGYSNREDYAGLAFSRLKLNIVRYNIGGGENPALASSIGYRARMQGFEPAKGVWDWNADRNQRWMLRAAEARGANTVVAFANSPPWWMTVSGSVAGAVDGTNNLKVGCETAFADYIATVAKKLTVLDGGHFDYVTPINEPSDGWKYDSGKQEGCHVSMAQQARLINDTRAALDASLPSARIDGPEDYSENDSFNDLVSYSSATLKNISLCATHTYKANAPARLRRKVRSLGKPLWVSEYGDHDATGLTMARRIRDDITGLRAQAWVYWQVVDSAPGWGFLYNPLTTNLDGGFITNYTVNQKFYAMGQFSEFIRPGSRIIRVGGTDTLAACDSSKSTIVLVNVNTNAAAYNVTYKLKGVRNGAWRMSVTRTSPGEEMASQRPAAVVRNRFSYSIPGESITTFVLTEN